MPRTAPGEHASALCNGDVVRRFGHFEVEVLFQRLLQRIVLECRGEEHARRHRATTGRGNPRRPIRPRLSLRPHQHRPRRGASRKFFPKWLTLRVEDICARYGRTWILLPERRRCRRRQKEEGVFADNLYIFAAKRSLDAVGDSLRVGAERDRVATPLRPLPGSKRRWRSLRLSEAWLYPPRPGPPWPWLHRPAVSPPWRRRWIAAVPTDSWLTARCSCSTCARSARTSASFADLAFVRAGCAQDAGNQHERRKRNPGTQFRAPQRLVMIPPFLESLNSGNIGGQAGIQDINCQRSNVARGARSRIKMPGVAFRPCLQIARQPQMPLCACERVPAVTSRRAS